MKKIGRKVAFDKMHIICIAITISFLLCTFFVFRSSFWRFIESCRDFGVSFAFFFVKLFVLPFQINVTVINLSDYAPQIHFADNWVDFKNNFFSFWQIFGSQENFLSYLSEVGLVVKIICIVLLCVVPFGVVLYFTFKNMLKRNNNKYDIDSKPLKIFKFLSKIVYKPLKAFFVRFFSFCKDKKAYYILWLIIWAFNFNLFTILLELFAFVLYFSITFDIANIYMQFYKFVLDISVAFTVIPWWVLIFILFFIIDKIRKNIAYNRLNHFEAKNCGFINERPVVYMVCGTMGKKKTTTITDMVLSQEVMFRQKAFEKILENDLKFPNFPWINLENELRRCMEYHSVYNLATVRKFIQKKRERWFKMPSFSKIFNYDYERYGVFYDDKLKVVNIWEVIETYAQLYFIYIIQSSLIISNYSIRSDSLISDLGNFPLWDSDFFKRDSKYLDAYSRHAHILDFDTLRLGKKVIENNDNADNFEFGVVVITEVGKERGNSLENQDLKKKDDSANRKNDLFNSWLKMVRHSATVDNFPFVRVITDEQRPESWGADARDLCEIITIKESGETRLAMPFFILGEIVYDWFLKRFENLYYRYRFNRGDNTLSMHLLKGIVAFINSYYKRIYNRFSYCVLNVEVESGTQDGKKDNKKYYLMSKKIYSKRFSTDCFSDFFTEKSLRSRYGLDDISEYATEKATFSELEKQNSYFVNDLLDGFKK